MDAGKMIEPIAERLQAGAGAKAVFGDPIEAHGKTIVPVATVAYGFGGGTGSGKRPGRDNGEGGGLGGGIRVIPKGVLEITDECTRFVRFDPPWKLLAAA